MAPFVWWSDYGRKVSQLSWNRNIQEFDGRSNKSAIAAALRATGAHLTVDRGDLLDKLPILLLVVTFRGRGTRFDTDILEL